MEDHIVKQKKSYISRLYGLLCEREKNGSWKEFLDKIILDTIDFSKDNKSEEYYLLIHKLSSLRYLSYEYFRTSVFECIKIVEKMNLK